MASSFGQCPARAEGQRHHEHEAGFGPAGIKPLGTAFNTIALMATHACWRSDDDLERVRPGKPRPARIYLARFQTTLTLSPVANTRTVNVSRSPVIEKMRV